ncbi:lysophospholipid acyltransferase family protein [Paeniglutamicibacter terrestris]|uniref:1-acyl-sn-glycerol-3-phosphate acyltransferase n=1 Tax=Paeniglutamicibacter terrestris TaxID=2723403 RepID=A0ABX1G8X0_9MICC|nr:lysophospholipid acyltransferase family protein [Paeniglutamicibacter terrestris]NKG22707.1 1-acyl-sn-glycerol-3-phosphate acyltransferase [Paeniglutamicibacter terrestris]
MKESRGTKTAFAIAAGIVRPLMNLMIGRTWRDFDKLPHGGFILCPNHVTEIDPLVVGHAIYSSKRYPHYLAKESLFKVPVLGVILRKTRQIPVARSSGGASQSLNAAREVIDANGVIVIYPEGTLTRDPDLWPMRGHTGAARLALQTGAPVIPMAHWGAQELFPRYAKGIKLFPRRRVTVVAGDAVDLDDLRDLPLTRTVLNEATDRIMRAITKDLAVLRGETAPEKLWDPAAHGQAVNGRDFEKGSTPNQTKKEEL